MSGSAARPRRIGLVDVGSNAVRTRVIEVADDRTSTLHDERTPIRVGHDVFVSGALTSTTIAGVAHALGLFRSVCDRLGVTDVRAVATSAARTARNGAELLRAVNAAGVDLQIIDGDREAALLHAAVGRRFDLSRGRSALVDLGAGSLEIVVIDAGARVSSASYPLGSLRLHDALPPSDRNRLGAPLLATLDALIAQRGAIAHDQLADARVERLLGIGSSIDIVADLEAGAGRGVSFEGVDAVPAAVLARWRVQLAELSASERTRQFGLSQDRADLVVVALSVYAWLLQQLAVGAVLVPRVSLRDGLLAEWLAESV